MADEFVLNKIDGASLAIQTDQERFIQSGSINNMDIAGIDPKDLLYRVIEIARNNNYSLSDPTTLFSVAHPNVLRRIEVTGYSDNGCNFLFYWEKPQLGPPTIYTIRKGTSLTPYQTDLLPGTRVPLRIGDTVVQGGYTVPGDNVLFTFMKPIERIQVYSVSIGEPRYASNRVGNVNDASWPTAGPSLPTFGGHNPTQEQKGIGYWLLTEWETTEERYTGYYSLTASAISRVDEDWSYSGLLIDTSTGKRIQLVDADATATAMMAPNYSYGIIYNSNGMIRVGPYRTTSFSALFGF